MDYTNQGDSPIMGVEKLIIKSHGSSTAKTIASCVFQACELIKARTIDKIREGLTALEKEQSGETAV